MAETSGITYHAVPSTPLESFRADLASARFHPGLLPHVAARFIDQPLMVEPNKLRTILAVVGPRFGVAGITPRSDMGSMGRKDRSTDYSLVDGIAIVPFLGSVVKRNEGGMLADSGLVSLEAFRETIAAASADPTFRAGIIQMDSYGGEAVGTPEVAQFLFDLRAQGKTWVCAIDDACYSAGYYLGAACSKVYISPSGGAGSIGVVALHVDASAAYAAEGLKITPIFAGERKIDGADYAPLSPEARDRFQARVDAIWSMFTADVGRFRSMSPTKLKSYQALTFYGADAVTAGLADAVMPFDDVVAQLTSRSPGAPARTQGGTRMSTVVTEPGAIEQPEKPRAEVIPIADARKLTEEGRVQARADERTRAKSIQGLATLARMPKDKAALLATTLIEEGVTLETAQTAFLAAQVEADKVSAAGVHITGQKGTEGDPAGAAGIHVPPMQSRETVMASRFTNKTTARRSAALAAVEKAIAKAGLAEGGI